MLDETSVDNVNRPKILRAAVAADDLLARCDRFFSGRPEDRGIELLQNSRRAKAKNVRVATNYVGDSHPHGDYLVTYHDDGEGVPDFNVLLHLGRSHWGQDIIDAEDPAGMGNYAFAPRELLLRSCGKRSTVTREVWFGRETALIEDDPDPVTQGLWLQFRDVDWDSHVRGLLRNCPLCVTLNGQELSKESFFLNTPHSFQATYPELGVTIEATPAWRLVDRYAEGLINFYGLRIGCDALRQGLLRHYDVRVEMSGQTTPLRFVLPARKELVSNAALERLIELATITAMQTARNGHRMPYDDYVEAVRSGVTLPEAEVQHGSDAIFVGGTVCRQMLQPFGEIVDELATYSANYRPFVDSAIVRLHGRRELIRMGNSVIIPCEAIEVLAGLSDGAVRRYYTDRRYMLLPCLPNDYWQLVDEDGSADFMSGVTDPGSYGRLILATVTSLCDPSGAEGLATATYREADLGLDRNETTTRLQNIGFTYRNFDDLVRIRIAKAIDEAIATLGLDERVELSFRSGVGIVHLVRDGTAAAT